MKQEINPQLTELRKELFAGESILWSESPNAWRMSRRSLIIYLFFIPWTAFSLLFLILPLIIFFFGHNSFQWMLIPFPIVGLLFTLIGFYQLAQPFYIYRKAKNTIYAITNKRAIIMELYRGRSMRFYLLQQIGNVIESNKKTNGLGSLYFHFTTDRYSTEDEYIDRIGFEMINDLPRVENILKQAVRNSKQ